MSSESSVKPIDVATGFLFTTEVGPGTGGMDGGNGLGRGKSESVDSLFGKDDSIGECSASLASCWLQSPLLCGAKPSNGPVCEI